MVDSSGQTSAGGGTLSYRVPPARSRRPVVSVRVLAVGLAIVGPPLLALKYLFPQIYDVLTLYDVGPDGMTRWAWNVWWLVGRYHGATTVVLAIVGAALVAPRVGRAPAELDGPAWRPVVRRAGVALLVSTVLTAGVAFACLFRPLNAMASGGSRSWYARDGTGHFNSYKDLYEFAAKQNGLSTDVSTLTCLARDSAYTRVCDLPDGRPLYVLAPQINTPFFSGLRGAQGNGTYYLLVPGPNGIDMVGEMAGNVYTVEEGYGPVRIRASWHVSAAESVGETLEWDGKRFRTTSKEPPLFGDAATEPAARNGR